MKQRDADISVTLVTKQIDDTNGDCVVINEFFPSKNQYKTTVYHLYK